MVETGAGLVEDDFQAAGGVDFDAEVAVPWAAGTHSDHKMELSGTAAVGSHTG